MDGDGVVLRSWIVVGCFAVGCGRFFVPPILHHSWG